MSEVIRKCDMCGAHHPADVTCQSAKELAEKIKESHNSEAMDYSGRNPMVALAIAEGWHGSEKFNAPDLLAALHQTTGIPFMREYVKRAMGEGVISPKTPKPFDDLGTRELMRLFKTAYDRYGLTSTKEDAPVAVNAGPRDNVVYMGKGEGEEFMIGDTTYKPEDDPACPIPASLLADRPVFVGTKRVMPFAMTRAQWCAFRGWEVPADENGDDAGFMVEYMDGGKPNHPGFKGYISWSPADVFVNAYQPETDPRASAPVSAAPMDGSKVQGYRKLPDEDIAAMNAFKAASRNLVDEIDTYKHHIEAVLNGPAMLSAEQAQQNRDALRWLAIARTHVQEGCMAACRAAAKPENDC